MTENQAGGPEKYQFSRAVTVPLRYWRLISVLVLVAVFVAWIFFLLQPATYVARAVLYPNQSTSSVGSATGELSSILGGGGGGADTRLIGLVLRSRSLADSVRARVGHAEAQIQEPGDGAFIVEARATDPEQAAIVANAYAQELNNLLMQISLETNRRKQMLIEKQLETARINLETAEKAVASLEREQGAPDISAQLLATVSNAAELEREIFQQELEVQLLRRTATEDSPMLAAANAELRAMQEQLQHLRVGRAGSLFPSLSASPEIKIRVSALLRQFTETEQTYIALAASHAAVQLAASEQLPVVSILDPALPPTAPAGDSLVATLGLAAILGALLGLLWGLARDAIPPARRNPAYAEIFSAWDRFRSEVAATVLPRRFRETRLSRNS